MGSALLPQRNYDLSATEPMYRVSRSNANTREIWGHLDGAEFACERLLSHVRMAQNARCQDRSILREDLPGIRVVAPALVVVPNRNDEGAHQRGAVC